MTSEIVFILNKEFYDEKMINEALDDFKEICTGKIVDGQFKIELQTKEDMVDLNLEFANYVLGLMKNNTLV